MIELRTEAELQADKARDFAGFKNLSLPGVKEDVAQLLDMIGRVEGLFSTYTKHDISHVDAMLGMLDWLVPQATKDAMTPIDWLMIVLSVYLHDLGMLVTLEEFEQRMENQDFREFLDKIENDPEGKEYLDRTERMTEEERERFFYQEYVRSRHPLRIREWITGRHSSHWGSTIKPIADEIAKILEDLPSRFRDHLGTVCQSHHDDNLERQDLFPLCARYGPKNAMANLQYAAVLLRTADLLHITGDRTPSIMYKLSRISDPKGVEEWAKQRETFSVNMRPREFDADDTRSHVVVVSADLTEERPFFSLTEYVAYADEQIRQSKRWIDKSRHYPDGKDFWLPWHSVAGDILVEGNEPQKMKFELDRGRLLDLLVGHTLYNEPTVAIRELLQNSIDAVRFQYYLDQRRDGAPGSAPPVMGQVIVRWDGDQRRLVVQDGGIGMDLDTIKYHLLRVGASYYDTPQFNAEHADFSPISRFGIGVLTCFMMSDDIEIVTCKGPEAYRIRMSSVRGDYLLKGLEPGDKLLTGLSPHGTRVTVKLRASIDLKQQSVQDIVRFWVILPECAVVYQEDGHDHVAIGHESVKEAMQTLYAKKLTEEPYSLESPEIMLRDQPEGNQQYELGLLVRRVFRSERGFVLGKEPSTAAVCVEGIRVDNRLPGFQNNSACSLLSVRGNRRFRTTVSRTELEHDEEYIRIAGICADLLIAHVRGEVNRIADKPGHPLLQASSASLFLTNALDGTVLDERVQKMMKARYRELPSVVIEKITQRGEDIDATREMISRSEVEKLPELWTIESRVVDNLGIISRDLGREVSISEFLAALAPDRCDPRITPLLLDANLMREPLLRTHMVVSADFSNSQQQTRIRWQQGQSWSAWCAAHAAQFMLGASTPDEAHAHRFDWFERVTGKRDMAVFFSRMETTQLGVMELAPVEGDDKRVGYVITRVARLLEAIPKPL
ncbi:MAG: hypothetical protein GY778_15200 [bacterium]|nr:hypothetical protein [bacterium]